MMTGTLTQRRPSVLVVEDDPIVRMSAVDLVEDAGFLAYEASNAAESVALLERHGDIRVLFTDIDMPGAMDGRALAWAVRRRWPPVVIVMASGHMTPAAEEMPAGAVFLRKPYPPSHLIRALLTAAARFE